jgi:hypothetical protein
MHICPGQPLHSTKADRYVHCNADFRPSLFNLSKKQ